MKQHSKKRDHQQNNDSNKIMITEDKTEGSNQSVEKEWSADNPWSDFKVFKGANSNALLNYAKLKAKQHNVILDNPPEIKSNADYQQLINGIVNTKRLKQ